MKVIKFMCVSALVECLGPVIIALKICKQNIYNWYRLSIQTINLFVRLLEQYQLFSNQTILYFWPNIK